MASKPVPLNMFDRLVAVFAPTAAVRRAHARQVLAYYEAAKPDRLRKSRRETGSGNDAVLRAGASLRQMARHLEQNYDLALGVLNTLVTNTVGAKGVMVEPMPRNSDGSINLELAKQILALYQDWCRVPEVTRQHNWSSAQRLMARSWLRDGEVFGQHVAGTVATLNHGTRVPYSIEMLEADYVPMELQSTEPLVIQGIEINTWGAPTGYHVYKTNPLEHGSMLALGQTKRIPATSMMHLKNVHRIRQLRGVSVFASVLTRFDDLKDYEESERIAAKIAASMAAFIRKGSPDLYTPGDDSTPRELKMRPGMIFDDLRQGEEIGTIDTNRPNPNLETYRDGQMRGIAAGTGPTASSVMRKYDGTYSAQRQELVEGYASYACLTDEFVGRVVQPAYENVVALAVASGQLKLPAGLRAETLLDAQYIAPQMPWIDPVKESAAWRSLVRAGFASEPEVIRKRGGNPQDVLEQMATFRQQAADRTLVLDSDAAKTSAAGTAQDYLRELAAAQTEQ